MSKSEREGTLQDAINDTLKLADSLNGIAERGGGFIDHWGERVMQAVEPLRNVEAFASKTLSHNRALLEHNGNLIRERDSLESRLACEVEYKTAYIEAKDELINELSDEITTLGHSLAEANGRVMELEFKMDHQILEDPMGIGPPWCRVCKYDLSPRHSYTREDWIKAAEEQA